MSENKKTSSLAGIVLGVISTRIELLSFELTEEKENLSQVLVLTIMLGSFLVLFVISLLGLALALLWSSEYRYWFIGGCAFLFGVAALWVIGILKRLIFNRVPFAMTIDELKADIASVRKPD